MITILPSFVLFCLDECMTVPFYRQIIIYVSRLIVVCQISKPRAKVYFHHCYFNFFFSVTFSLLALDQMFESQEDYIVAH